MSARHQSCSARGCGHVPSIAPLLALALACATASLLGCSTEATIRLLRPTAGPPDSGSIEPPPPPPVDMPDAAPASDPLVLRYDFEGAGTTVLDRVGSAHAQLMGGAVLDGMGGVVLDGTDDYVDLPNGVLSQHVGVTIAAWLHWRGGVCWQRILDFGSNDRGEGQVGNGLTSLYLTPGNCIDGSYFASVELPDARSSVSAVRFPEDRLAQAVLRFDPSSATLTIFMDGEPVGQVGTSFELAEIDDVNAWLGQSQWIQDRNLAARYDELRIYDRALTDEEIATTYARGPDAP